MKEQLPSISRQFKMKEEGFLTKKSDEMINLLEMDKGDIREYRCASRRRSEMG